MPINFINILKEYKVIIPIIQRGYAQGRNTFNIRSIRENFIETLINFLKDNKEERLILDFIYGVCNDDENKKELYLLDGQQRLTTLFLLHWYILDYNDEEFELLKKFNYETRVSSSDFISFLLDYKNIKEIKEKNISEIIKEDKNFLIFWQSDPTVNGMLVVLDSIEKQIKEAKLNIKNLKERLKSILFYKLDIKDSDHEDLYVKMNSRGKPLTDFEIFKSKLYTVLEEANYSKYQLYREKMDTTWSHFIWGLVKDIESESSKIEKYNETFYNLFLFLIEMLYKEQYDKKIDKYNASLFSLVVKNINTSDTDTNIEENLDFIFETIDFFISHENIKDFFNDIFCYNDFNNDKPLISTYYKNINIFEKNNENDLILNHINNYEIQYKIILFFFLRLLHLKNFSIDPIIDKDKIRLIRNYVFFITHYYNKEQDYKKYLEDIMPIFSKIIKDDELNIDNFYLIEEDINDYIHSFIEHEKAKKEILYNSNKEHLREIIYRLENNRFLRGDIAFILEYLDSCKKKEYEKIIQIINIIFSYDYGINISENNSIINRAMMTFIEEEQLDEMWIIDLSYFYKNYNNHKSFTEFIKNILNNNNKKIIEKEDIIEISKDLVKIYTKERSRKKIKNKIDYLVIEDENNNTIYSLSNYFHYNRDRIKFQQKSHIHDFYLNSNISTVLYNLKEEDEMFKDFNFYYYTKDKDKIIENDKRILKYKNGNIIFGYSWVTLGKEIEGTNFLIAISTNNYSDLEFGLRKIKYTEEILFNDDIKDKINELLNKTEEYKDYKILNKDVCWYFRNYRGNLEDYTIEEIEKIIEKEYENIKKIMSIFEK